MPHSMESINEKSHIVHRTSLDLAFARAMALNPGERFRALAEFAAALAVVTMPRPVAGGEATMAFPTSAFDRPVRLGAARHALEAMTTRGAVEAWIFDDTGFIKQGDMSPGVQRQYTGSAGKTTNCQLGVSLTIATRTV